LFFADYYFFEVDIFFSKVKNFLWNALSGISNI